MPHGLEPRVGVGERDERLHRRLRTRVQLRSIFPRRGAEHRRHHIRDERIVRRAPSEPRHLVQTAARAIILADALAPQSFLPVKGVREWKGVRE